MDSKQQTISESVTTVNGRQIIRREDLGPGYWTVKSDDGDRDYMIAMNANIQYCSCNDHQYRGRVCKHMRRIMEVD